MNIPNQQLEKRLAELPKRKEVVAHCRGPYCLMSFEAVKKLRKHGLPARQLEDSKMASLNGRQRAFQSSRSSSARARRRAFAESRSIVTRPHGSLSIENRTIHELTTH